MVGQMLVTSFYSHFYTVLFLLLTVTITHCLRLKCKEHEYPFGEKCCKDCAPGERMRNRCTEKAETDCVPCQDEYFSTEHNHSFCKSCTVCDTRMGSIEVKKCEKTSDRICMCIAGYMPDAKHTLGSVCLPCREGFYSTGGNESCQPWTNCSVLGKKTLRMGTKTEDAVCSSQLTQPTTSRSVTSALHLFTTHRRKKMSTAMISSSKPSVVPLIICPDKNSPTETNWGPLSLIVICLILLMVSGMSILLLIIQAAKKETERRPCTNNNQRQSFRLPIQEEQIDSDSSLIKN
ncbi:tumor necrosis factor receptor superfamily member 4 [Rhea pennata]|uniref:tumor necrosis factor receptor superfamily member 4 n=1 Tax=Rhea pennata TaxID=8795 RepID=UPI002E267087